MYKFSLIFLFTSLTLFAQERGSQSGGRFELLSGTKKGKEVKTYWDKKYNNEEYVFGKTPAKFLSLNYNYIPAGSRVLDMGMGEGRNAVFLARKGYKVTGVDISSVAVKKARLLAREFGVRINTVVASLNNYRIPKNTLDAVVCFYYVDRSLNKRMVEWLKPGGILIYESHTDNQRKVKGNENYDKRYLLREAELLTMFPGMRVLKYEEPIHLGNYTTSIILQKKKPE
ncbi:MAG: SAM-dependent methyltransferase [Bacteriovoracaceae bacterium]|jgi:SAM-dependent methyltransferase